MKTKAQFICAGILLATLLNCSGQPIIIVKLRAGQTCKVHSRTFRRFLVAQVFPTY